MASQLNYSIGVDTSQADSALAKFASGLKTIVSQAGAGGNPFGNFIKGADKANGAIATISLGLNGIRTLAATAAAAFAKETVDAAKQAEAAFKGLESVANRTGVGIEKAYAAVKKLTSDGSLTDSQASTALKNLFAFGLTDVDKAVALIERFKDSAAFGRQASLDFGEAVVSATEGLKNENSALVDNAGVTKNVAKMYEEYADKIGVAYTSLTQSQKVQAAYNGILKETTNQLGDNAKRLSGAEAGASQLSKSYSELKVQIGDKLNPAFEQLEKAGAKLIDNVLKPMVELGDSITRAFASVAGLLVDVVKAFKEADTFEQFDAKLRQKTKEQASGIAAGLRNFGYAVGLADSPYLPPPPPKNTAGIPDPSTNTTGIPIVGMDGKPLMGPTAGTRNVKNNIDKAAVEAAAKEKAAEEEKALAKQEVGKREKALQRAKQAASDELSVYKAGLDAQKAQLDLMLEKGTIDKVTYAKRAAALETQELTKEQELRAKRITTLQEQVAFAKKTGDKEILAEAQANLDSELSAEKAAASKSTAARIDAEKEVVAATRESAAERQRIEETLLAARLSATSKVADAVRERDQAQLDADYADRLISEKDYLQKSKALKDKALDEELAGIAEQRAMVEKMATADATEAANKQARLQALDAQEKTVTERRATLNIQTNERIRRSEEELARLRSDLNEQLLESEGKTFEARSAAIEAWLEQKRKEFAAFPELVAKAEAIAGNQSKKNTFDQTTDQVSRDSITFDRERFDLQQQVTQGKVTELEAEMRQLEVNREQAALLRQRIETLKAASDQSTGSLQTIAQLEQQALELEGSFSATAQSINDSFFSSLEKGFNDLLFSAKSFKDVLRGILIDVLKQIAQVALKAGFQQLFGGAMAGGGGLGGAVVSAFTGRATGGAAFAGAGYMVGERGPELFFPGANGAVVPTGRIMDAIQAMTVRQRRAQLPLSTPRFEQGTGTTVDNAISVAPRVTVSTRDIIEALAADPEFERFHVRLSLANKKRLS